MEKAIKIFLVFVTTALTSHFAIAQTPYDDFAPCSKAKEMLKLPEVKFKIVNSYSANYLIYDKEKHTLTYFSNEDSILEVFALDPSDYKWLSVDPLAKKYPQHSPYNFVEGSPVNSIDPDGRDIIVLNNPNGASGYGHMAVLIGNDKTGWTFISKEGRDKTPWYSNELTGGPALKPLIGVYTSLDAFKKAQTTDENLRNYTQNVRFATTAKQDKSALTATTEAAKSWYNLGFNNCADAVSDGLSAAGLNPGFTYTYGYGYAKSGEPTKSLDARPSVRFEQIKKNNIFVPTFQSEIPTKTNPKQNNSKDGN
jgi:hypothetical protein